MDKIELLAIFDREQRIDFRLPGYTYETTPHTVFDYSLEDGAGYIDYAALDETNAQAEIQALLAFFAARGMPFTWKVFDHDRPADLRQRLAEHGFAVDEPDALLILDLHVAPGLPAAPEPPGPSGGIQRLAGAAGVEQIVRLEEAVYGASRDWLRKYLLQILDATPDHLSLFAVVEGERAVSGAWIHYYPPSLFARLLGGATLPAYRRSGFYTALLHARIAEARRRGCRFLVVDASPMSRPVLEKHGFQFLGFSTRCHWSPQEQPGQ